MNPEIITGDILDQNVDIVVNSWNRNIIPCWLLLPQGICVTICPQDAIKLEKVKENPCLKRNPIQFICGNKYSEVFVFEK